LIGSELEIRQHGGNGFASVARGVELVVGDVFVQVGGR
jgi:hypothetical protein